MYLVLNNTDSIELEKFHEVSLATEGNIEDRTNFIFPKTAKTPENIQMLKKYLKTNQETKFTLKVVNELGDEAPILETEFDGFTSIEYILYGGEVQFITSLVYILD